MCPWCTGAPFWSVVTPGPCGPQCVYYRGTTPAPVQTYNTHNTYQAKLTDEDIERIAKRLAEILRDTKG